MKHGEQLRSPRRRGKGLCGLVGVLFLACSPAMKPEPPVAAPTGDVPPNPSTPARTEPLPSPPPGDAGTSEPAPTEPSALPPVERALPASFPCAEHTCYQFAQARDALVPLLLHEKAQLIAFGEAHTPATFQGESTVHRFTRDLLPTIASGTSHLLVELLLPPSKGCAAETAATDVTAKEVTQGQAHTNQNEYIALGLAARKWGITPDILRATCTEMSAIAAPEGGLLRMMETIAQLSARALKSDLRSTKPGRPLVLAYGGALHNDASPKPERATWTYGPEMLTDTQGRYLEVDLIVPELIAPTESWKSFAWYDAYAALGHQQGAVLMKWGEHSFALFFPPGAITQAP